MLASIDLFVLEVIVTLELRVASSHRVSGFQQIVTKISVTRFDQVCRFGLIIASTEGISVCCIGRTFP